MEKIEKIQTIAPSYYSRKDVQEEILRFSKSREVVARYFESFGKRPDTLEYSNDILQQVKKGATSFHCSEEIWHDPLRLSTELSKSQLDELRTGWDLLIDIDSKYFDYSKIMTRLIIQALNFHNIKNIGLKFSGNKGLHIIVPWKAFPEELNEDKLKNLFPEIPRAISLYLLQLIKKDLIKEITRMTSDKEYIKDFEEAEKVIPDLVLVSSRHLFRAPYSLHEKTGLASVVIDPKKIQDFHPENANPLKVKVIPFLPKVREEEARELLLQALDWYKEQKKEIKTEKSFERKFEEVKVDKSRIVFPPSINNILNGMKDGRKRALFILINYFRCLNFSKEEINARVDEWNKKNENPLKEGYIKSQFDWNFRQKKVLPPNFDKPYYKDIGIVPTEEEIKYKNPVNYTIKRMR